MIKANVKKNWGHIKRDKVDLHLDWWLCLSRIYWCNLLNRKCILVGSSFTSIRFWGQLNLHEKRFRSSLIIIWMIYCAYVSNNAGRSDWIETLPKVIEPNLISSSRCPGHYRPQQNHHHHHCCEASTKFQWPRFNKSRRDEQRVQRLNPVLFRDSASHEWKYRTACLSKSRYPTYWASQNPSGEDAWSMIHRNRVHRS